MSCPHAETTVAWLYGEAPEAHLHHVAGCAECQAVADAHERVAHAVSGIAPALRSPPVARPAPRRGWWIAGGLAAAAAALMIAWAAPPREVADTDGERLVAARPAPFADDDVDAALDDLEADLDALTADLDAF